MEPARFEYTAYHKGDHIIVSVLLVEDIGDYKVEVGSLIFNIPEVFGFQYHLWNVTMRWAESHVFMGMEYD